MIATRPSAPLAPTDYGSLEKWEEHGRSLLLQHNSLQWDVACWLTDGEDCWPESLQIAENMGVSQHRIYQSRYIVKACRSLQLTYYACSGTINCEQEAA